MDFLKYLCEPKVLLADLLREKNTAEWLISSSEQASFFSLRLFSFCNGLNLEASLSWTKGINLMGDLTLKY
jgi:hypothetical protein